MTEKERQRLKDQVKEAGGRTSRYDDNVQFLGTTKIVHGTGNVTTFDGKPAYGPSSAGEAINKAK